MAYIYIYIYISDTCVHILNGTLENRDKIKHLNSGKGLKIFNPFTVKRRKVTDKTERLRQMIDLYVDE
jgi:hypothetical protein